MAQLPATLYLVVRNFGHLGIGSGDICPAYGHAYDQFADAVEAGEPVTVWEIDVTGDQPRQITDATDNFEADLLRTQRLRGLDITPARRFDPGISMAAE